MVLILGDGVSDPKVAMMLRCLREKNEKYNSLSRLDDIIVKYKNEVDKEEKDNKPSHTKPIKVSGWEKK